MNEQDPQLEACALCVESLLVVLRDTNLSNREWLLALHAALVGLHRAVLNLRWPAIDSSDVELPNNGSRDEHFRETYALVEARLGKSRFYWTQRDASGPELEPEAADAVVGDVADDVADIVRDVAPALRAWRSDSGRYAKACAWEWRATPFESHWGRHLVSASVAIHHLLFSRGVE